MSMFFVGANKNHALILETFGIPTIATREKLYMPTPCCQGAKSLRTSNEFSFHTSEFTTADGTQLSVQCAASYTIDSSSSKNIMKAYKSFPIGRRQVFRYPTRAYIPSEVSVEEGIKDIISKLVINNVRGMTIGDLSTIDLMFIDSIFQEAKEDLRSHYIKLTSFKVMELVRYNEIADDEGEGPQEVSEEDLNVAEESLVESGNPDFDFSDTTVELNVEGSAGEEPDIPDIYAVVDDEDVETRSYIISFIPEESARPGFVRQITTTSEIVLEHSQKIITTERDASGEVTITEREVLSVSEADKADPASVDVSTTDMTAVFQADDSVNVDADTGANAVDVEEESPRERSGGFSIAAPPDIDISAEVVSAETYDADTDADTERSDSFNFGASPSGSFNVQGEKDISAGAGEKDISAGAGEMDISVGAGEKDISPGAGEMDISVGAGEKDISPGAGEMDISVGAGGKDISPGAGEMDISVGAGEKDISAGAGEMDISAGAGEKDISAGAGEMDISVGAGVSVEGNFSVGVGASAGGDFEADTNMYAGLTF